MGAPLFWRLMQAMLSSFLAFVAFGTRKGILRYRICAPCSKRLPTVRDAFSEALRAQNRLLGYGRNIRYRKRPPTVRDTSSEAQNSRLADCGQPPAVPDTFSEAQNSLLPHRMHLQHKKRPPTARDAFQRRETADSDTSPLNLSN